MPTDEAQQLEDLTAANETLREENERLREALVHIEQIAFVAQERFVPGAFMRIARIIRDAIWTPTANVADPETF